MLQEAQSSMETFTKVNVVANWFVFFHIETSIMVTSA